METLTFKTTSDFESPVLDIIQNRKSRRAYANQPVEADKIKSWFEAAKWAPSSMNDQPWVYIYATKDQPELWNKIFDALNDSNKVWAKEATLLIASLARKYFSLNGKPNGSAIYDLGAANAFLTLQATALQLNVHQMGGYNHDILISNLNISADYELGVILAIGYRGDADTLPDNLKQRELAPRARHLQREFVLNQTF
ncbi:MAG: nitroreductase family protein [Flammeovirgaceae bacterium]